MSNAIASPLLTTSTGLAIIRLAASKLIADMRLAHHLLEIQIMGSPE